MSMKFRAHETFFIRKGWLSKGMKNVINKPNVFVDKLNNPMDTLGIGANMVKSLRYWLQVTGLTVEGKGKVREQNLAHYILCSINWLQIKKTQLHGTISSIISI